MSFNPNNKNDAGRGNPITPDRNIFTSLKLQVECVVVVLALIKLSQDIEETILHFPDLLLFFIIESKLNVEWIIFGVLKRWQKSYSVTGIESV